MTNSTKIFRLSAALGALLVTACAHLQNGPEDAMPVEQRFPIMVEPHMESLRLSYDATRGNLDQASSAELLRFTRDYLENGSGAIAISAPRRLPGASDYITGRLVALGVPRARIMVGTDDALANANDVKVTYIRYQAQATPCGDWSVNLGDTAENKASPNLGCATQHNLAAMVADPRDLVTPKPLDPDDVQRRLTVLEKYRKGETTVVAKTAEQSGAVSGVGASGGGK
ncbi:MAG TPA: CpaD family pilus assembly protein [Micropepsaceae bacterium]|nr:CpaD family pilus assembly protein [Micropepsaceae bacterium]